MGFFEKLKQGLSKPASSISSVFTASELDDDFYDDLEESLIVSDLGSDTTETVMDRLRQTVREQHIKTVDEAKIALRAILADMLNVGDSGLRLDTKPSVILVIGVNGVGKTTTIGKLAHQLHDQGKKVLLCAGDTFRAAAADQLEIWANRAGVDIVRQNEGADPGAVLFDALAAAKARRSDVVLVDTAGRLHNKQNLMNELAKLRKITEEGVVAVQQFSLEIADKEFIVLVGPSGCGKSTTLRMIAGLEDITSGELWIGDRLMNDVEPKDRDIAMVFQNYALYPHLTVFENMAFSLRLKKVPNVILFQRSS